MVRLTKSLRDMLETGRPVFAIRNTGLQRNDRKHG